MPTYEYACRSCGEHLEVVQSFKDDALTTCAGCGGELRKVFGAIGIAFKGSGFYKNDSRTKSSSGAKSHGDSDKKTDKSDQADKKSGAGAGASDGATTKSDTSTATPATKADSPSTKSEPKAAASS